MEARCHSTSAPAQKLGPSPARTTARASPTSANASVSSRDQGGVEGVAPLGLRDRDAQDGSPSRSIRSALIAGSIGLPRDPGRSGRGGDAASRRRGAARRGRVRATRRLPRRGRAERASRHGHDGRGHPPRAGRAAAGHRSLRGGVRRAARRGRALRRADDRRHCRGLQSTRRRQGRRPSRSSARRTSSSTTTRCSRTSRRRPPRARRRRSTSTSSRA